MNSPTAPGACPACGHHPVGRPPERLTTHITKLLRQPVPHRVCPAWRRDDTFADAEPCACEHPSHRAQLWSGDAYDYLRDTL